MNNDLISREALKKAINDNGCRHSHYFDIFDVIDNAPTVEPERPHCKWKREEIDYAIETSACTFHNGKTYYEKEDLMKSMEDLGLFEDEKGEEE